VCAAIGADSAENTIPLLLFTGHYLATGQHATILCNLLTYSFNISENMHGANRYNNGTKSFGSLYDVVSSYDHTGQILITNFKYEHRALHLQASRRGHI
jgi:hypothetical protein